MPLTSIPLQAAFFAHRSSLNRMKPYWHPIFIDKKKKDGSILQVSVLLTFIDYDDTVTLTFLRFVMDCSNKSHKIWRRVKQ